MTGGVARTVVVVGASLAGLRTCQALRRRQFEGRIVLVGAERHLPYDRVPMSKTLLIEPATDLADLAFVSEDELAALGLDVLLGVAAVELCTDSREVVLADGRRIAFDALVVATGVEPLTLPSLDPERPGVHYLRTIEHAVGLRESLSEAERVVAVGGGFIACEVAASASTLGREVTLITIDPVLMPQLGAPVAEFMTEMHRANGVRVLTSTSVRDTHDDEGRLVLGLDNNMSVTGDLTVVGVGVTAAVGWLTGSGLDISRAGVRCDAFGRTSLDGIYAVGDAAHRYSSAHGDHIPTGHFQAAVEHAETVARHLTDDLLPPVDPPAYFWSDQFAMRIQVLGDPALASDHVVIGGEDPRGRIAVLYGNGSELVAAATVGDPRTFLAIRQLFNKGADYATAIAQFDRTSV
jgi:NADPH-dependent 2,4-dienoyl-CoA reductase/sulfur reductase-like enzyme